MSELDLRRSKQNKCLEINFHVSKEAETIKEDLATDSPDLLN
jgi:hypothetical protein